ncbi:MAG: OmpA family protein [Chromatiales bacterium]
MSVARRTPLALLVALAVSLSACETTNPYTGEKEVSKATTGTAIGAAAGAVAGAIFGGGRKSVLISAGVGALAGGLVGNYMDEQDAKLRARLQGTGVSVTRVGDQIILNMPGNVTFASNSSNISAGFYPVLDSVALVLNEYDKTYVDIVGYTDSTGSDELNQRLSEERALSVAQYLKSHQVLAERIVTRGMGPKSPVASNATPEGRALNRRVEIVLTPIT